MFAPEPENVKPPTRIREAVILPLKDFFSRENAFLILSFALLYKLGESMASSMTTPLYLSVGFSKVDIGLIAKTIGMGATISGGLIGGYLLLRMPIKKALYLFGILQAVFLLSFSVLSFTGPVKEILALAIGAEAFTSAMATSAYGAFLASVCNRKFSATQYALFSSLMGVPRVLFSTPTGYIVNSVGFGVFFVLCAIN